MFTEASLEKLICDKISKKGYTYTHGDNITDRELENVLIDKDATDFLVKKYGLTLNEAKRKIQSLKQISCSPLYDGNKKTFNEIVRGSVFPRDDKSQKDLYIKMFDFDNVDNNIFRVCNQVVIKGPQNKRIPDTIIYINGLPMVVFEFKSTVKEDVTIYDAYVQLTTRYTRDIPELYKYNAFVVVSDGVNSKMGSLFADYEHFYAWRRVDEDSPIVDGVDSLFTMIDGLFDKQRLMDVINNFVFFPDNSCTKELKIVCNYPQYYAARKLMRSVMQNKKPLGDGKAGVYFGTTGCGKSIGMLFTARLLMRNPDLESPTIVMITDRTDLDDQLSEYFTMAKEFIGDANICQISSRELLKQSLENKGSGGVFLTTIQKFTEDLSLLSDRSNIICISDEAHRSQNNLDQKVKITKTTVETKYGYAKYLHDSFPNASYIGFSGTPTEETISTFGNIVDKYTMKDSVRDEITVRLVYDGRLVKAVLDEKKLYEIEKYYQDALDNGANEYQVEESKKKSIGVRSIMGDHDILTNVAKCFVEHYENRVKEGTTVKGKAMFVAPDRQIAWEFLKIVKDLKPEWFIERKAPEGTILTEEQEKKLLSMPMIQMVATRGKDDPKEMYEYLGNDEYKKTLAKQFKDENSNFKIAVVVDMWLTGFDVPCLDTLYIDKLINQRHTIIQTISRVNRAYPGKNGGLIVDFAGIKLGIDLALKEYADYNTDEFEEVDKAITIVKDQLDVLDNMFYKFDNSLYFKGDEHEKLQCLNKSVEFIQATKELEQRFMAAVKRMKKAFNLCNGCRDFTDKELDYIHYYLGVRAIIFKLNKGDAPDIDTMNKTVQAMVHNAIAANNAEELFSLNKNLNAHAIDLFDPEYLKKLQEIELPNTKIKLLEQLLKQAIEEFKKVNKIKATTFSERLKHIIDIYNDRTMDLALVSQVIDKTTEMLIDLINDIRTEKNSFEGLGIDYEEKAFYDVLRAVEAEYGFDYPEEKNIELSKQIKSLVTNKDKYSNWLRRDDIKAELQVGIIRLLAKNGFPDIPEGTYEDYNKVYSEVIEQAENFRKYYNA